MDIEKIKDNNLSEVLKAFGFSDEALIQSVKSGLINKTYFISEGGRKIVLQQINSHVFKNPEDIISNYSLVYSFLKTNSSFSIPEMILTASGNSFFIDKDSFYWRATGFVESSVTIPLPDSPHQAKQAAGCFGKFTMALKDFSVKVLKEIIQRFHDLEFRYSEFQSALKNDTKKRKNDVLKEIDELEKRKNLIGFFTSLKTDPGFHKRVMHHDAKISNILFHEKTGDPICPVDLDTMQPGFFFSDLGDMVRTMTCSLPENSKDFDNVFIKKEFYIAITEGYINSLSGELSTKETDHIHYSGLIMIYMQALRYLTDFLNGDIYYHVEHSTQNLERTKNQLALLSHLELFLETDYGFHF